MIYFGYEIKESSHYSDIFVVRLNEKVVFTGDYYDCIEYVQRLVLKR